MGGEKKGAPIADKPELHPQRTLCYHFKAAHDALAQHVSKGNIRFDTPLEFEVEHCTTKRPVWHCTQRPGLCLDIPLSRFCMRVVVRLSAFNPWLCRSSDLVP